MKIRNYLFIAFLLAFTGCELDSTVEQPVFDVSTEKTTFSVGEEVKFNFTGNPDLISFYSGEVLNDYAYKGGRVIQPGVLKMSFHSNVQFGKQPDQLSVLASTDFNGNYSFNEGIFQATWQDITSKFTLATGSTFKESGVVDISDLRVENKPLYIAFKYNVKDQAPPAAGGFDLGRTWKIQNFALTAETSIGQVLLGDNATSAFQLVDLKPEEAPMRSKVTAALITLVAHSATGDNAHRVNIETENWAISKRFEVGAQDLGPDKPIPVKGMIDEAVSSFSHTYSKEGTYKVYFVAANADINGTKEVIKEFTITIIP